MNTPVSIANQALALVGIRTQIQNFNQDTPESNAVALFYQPEFEALARSANWNCLRKQIPLTVLKAAPWTPEGQSGNLPVPPTPWSYEYAEPSDCLRVRFIVPFANQQQVTGNPPLMTNMPAPIPWLYRNQAVKFVVSTDTNTQGQNVRVILTNKPQAQMVYTANITDTTLWDSAFTKAFVNTLAAWLVNPLNRNAALLKDLINMANALIAEARRDDGDEGITSADHEPDWIRTRFSSGIWGGYNGGDNWNWQAYDQIMWPNASLY